MDSAARRRLRACVEAWPECESGAYDPRCCRFPKSCSCTVYDEEHVTESDHEQRPDPPAATAIDFEATTYSLWFNVNDRGWSAWSSECKSPIRASTHRQNCLQRFPEAETVLVMRVERREVLSPEREANLTWRPDRGE